MEIGVLLILQKIEEGTFFPKNGKVGKIEGEVAQGEQLMFVANFVLINPRNITIQGIYKSNNF